MTAARPDVCVVSGGDEVRYRSYVNHTVYARLHGFTHHIGIGLAPGITSPYYYKFEIIREILPRFDWVLYLDDDVYVTDLHGEQVQDLIRDCVAADGYLVLAEGPPEPDGSWTRVNSGVMLLRNDPRTFAFLAAAQSMDLQQVHDTWDPETEGLYTFGDQDAIWRTIRADPAGVRVVEHRRLNSRVHYYDADLADAFAVHFCGPGDKVLKVARFGRRFGLGQELVPAGLLDEFSVRRRERLGDAELVGRDAALRWRAARKRVRRKVAFVRETGRWK